MNDTVEVEGCVSNPDGSPAAGVIVSGSGVDYSGRTSAITNNEGRFVMSVRRSAITSIWAATHTRVTPITELTVGETGGGISGECMRLEASTSPIPGQLAPRIMQNPRNPTNTYTAITYSPMSRADSRIRSNHPSISTTPPSTTSERPPANFNHTCIKKTSPTSNNRN